MLSPHPHPTPTRSPPGAPPGRPPARLQAPATPQSFPDNGGSWSSSSSGSGDASGSRGACGPSHSSEERGHLHLLLSAMEAGGELDSLERAAGEPVRVAAAERAAEQPAAELHSNWALCQVGAGCLQAGS